MVHLNDLQSIWDRLTEDGRLTLLVLARHVLRNSDTLAMVPFSTPQMCEAFHRLHQSPDTVNILLTFPRGGGQAVKGIDATGRAREEDPALSRAG